MPNTRHSPYRFALGDVSALVALSLFGCANESVMRWSTPSKPALVQRLSERYRHNPILTRVTLTPITGKYAKAASFGIWVLAADRTWNATLVRSTNIASAYQDDGISQDCAYFASHSSHTLTLPFARSDLTYAAFATRRHFAEFPYRILSNAQRVWRKSNCRHLMFKIGLMARGGLLGTTGNTLGFDGRSVYSGYGGYDKWSFYALLTLYFNEDSKLLHYRPDLTHMSRERRLVFLKAE